MIVKDHKQNVKERRRKKITRDKPKIWKTVKCCTLFVLFIIARNYDERTSLWQTLFVSLLLAL